MPTVKVVLVGASGVGKTSIRSKYISGQFSTSYRATIGADFISKTLAHPTAPDQSVTLQIWDTAGQERFSSLSSAFFRGADAALLIFDVNQPHTMDALVKWWDEFKKRAPLADEDVQDYCCVVVGNKVDVVDDPAVRVSEADALHFLDVLVPSSPDTDEPDTPTRPSASAIAIAPGFPPAPPLTPPPFRPSSSTRYHSQTGTVTSVRSIYHTPSSSLFEQYHSALTSPEPSSDATVYLTPGSPRRRRTSVSSESSGSAMTVTPSLFARSRAGETPISPLGRPQKPDRYPRLFFTSAKTGEGLSEVFSYVAGRVVKRWEYEAAMDGRENGAGVNATDTIRLGLAALSNARRPKRERCC